MILSVQSSPVVLKLQKMKKSFSTPGPFLKPSVSFGKIFQSTMTVDLLTDRYQSEYVHDSS